MIYSKLTRRSKSGVNVVELALNSALMIVIVGITLDITLLMLAASINDMACRDAARAAGAVLTTDMDTYDSARAKALAAAQAQMVVHSTDGYFISQPKVTMPVFFCPPSGTGITDPDTGQWGPEQNYQTVGNGWSKVVYPYVVCVSEVSVRLPLNVSFFSQQLNGGKPQTFTRAYTYPMVRTKMVSAGSANQ